MRLFSFIETIFILLYQMILNLCDGVSLENKEREVLYNSTVKTRYFFNSLIENLTNQNKKDYKWWFTELASRNIFSNNLFHHLSYLTFIEDLLKEKNIDKILVSSPSLFKVLSNSKLIRIIIFND